MVLYLPYFSLLSRNYSCLLLTIFFHLRTILEGISLLQQLPTFIALQHLHLLDGNLVEFDEPFALRYTVVDKYGIYVLHIPLENRHCFWGKHAHFLGNICPFFANLFCI